jgi:DNA-binding transcriptional LysR family regulator
MPHDAAPPIDLNALRLFYEVVARGGMARAAEATGVPKATVSRRLRALETELGATLLKRGARGAQLTDVGAALYEHARRIVREAEEAANAALDMQSELAGLIRIATPPAFGGPWMSEVMTRFAERHPRIRLVIHATNRRVDVAEEPFDLAIQIGRVRNEGLTVRKLAEIERGVYASPRLAARVGAPERLADLPDFDCIVLETHLEEGVWAAQVASRGGEGTPPRATVSDVGLARELAIAGLGFAILPVPMCEDDLAEGRLVRVIEHERLPTAIAWATFLQRRHMPLRVRAFLDFLSEHLSQRRPLSAAAEKSRK